MLTNSQMISGRFAKWARARKRVAVIVAALEAGRTVQLTTATRYTRYTVKHVAMFKATKTGAFVQRGKAWDCIDFTHVTAF